MATRSPFGLAVFDSAAAFLGGTAAALHGRGFPALGRSGAEVRFGHLVNTLPAAMRELAFGLGGATEGVAPHKAGDIDTEAIAEWITGRYPEREFPAIVIGSSNGALAHAAALIDAPFLPQTFLTLLRHKRRDPDDARLAMEADRRAAEALLASNPRVALHHMHDPNQDRRMTPWATYFRLKFQRLPDAYRRFIEQRLAPGGTIFLSECGLTWPVTRLGDRHVFQFGAAGGATKEEYLEGGPRLAALFEKLGIDRRRWDPPPPDGEAPEAEWGFDPALSEDIAGAARACGARTVSLRHQTPEDPSAKTADLFRRFFEENGVRPQRLLVPSFVLHDPYTTIATASVPYWMLFNVERSQRGILDYAEAAGPFDQTGLMLFSNGTEAIGQASIDSWQALLERLPGEARFFGVDREAYPRDFASLKRYHEALAACPAVLREWRPAPPAWLEDALRGRHI